MAQSRSTHGKRKIRIHISRKQSRLLRFAFNAALLVVFAVSLFLLVRTLFHYKKDRSTYDAAAAQAVSTNVPSAAPAFSTPEPMASATPEPLETPPVTVDFAAVQQESYRVRAWIYDGDTPINYPVMLYVNNEYYLDHSYLNVHNKAGAIFMDCRNTKTLSEDNIILYGHNMKDGSMFASLLSYRKQSYYEAHPTLYLLSPDQNYRIDVFAARGCKSDAVYYPTTFYTQEERQSFLTKAYSQSLIDTSAVSVPADAKLITFSTCSSYDAYEDAKFQVLGFLTPIG